jgi:hypothetical protein
VREKAQTELKGKAPRTEDGGALASEKQDLKSGLQVCKSYLQYCNVAVFNYSLFIFNY